MSRSINFEANLSYYHGNVPPDYIQAVLNESDRLVRPGQSPSQGVFRIVTYLPPEARAPCFPFYISTQSPDYHNLSTDQDAHLVYNQLTIEAPAATQNCIAIIFGNTKEASKKAMYFYDFFARHGVVLPLICKAPNTQQQIKMQLLHPETLRDCVLQDIFDALLEGRENKIALLEKQYDAEKQKSLAYKKENERLRDSSGTYFQLGLQLREATLALDKKNSEIAQLRNKVSELEEKIDKLQETSKKPRADSGAASSSSAASSKHLLLTPPHSAKSKKKRMAQEDLTRASTKARVDSGAASSSSAASNTSAFLTTPHSTKPLNLPKTNFKSFDFDSDIMSDQELQKTLKKLCKVLTAEQYSPDENEELKEIFAKLNELIKAYKTCPGKQYRKLLKYTETIRVLTAAQLMLLDPSGNHNDEFLISLSELHASKEKLPLAHFIYAHYHTEFKMNLTTIPYPPEKVAEHCHEKYKYLPAIIAKKLEEKHTSRQLSPLADTILKDISKHAYTPFDLFLQVFLIREAMGNKKLFPNIKENNKDFYNWLCKTELTAAIELLGNTDVHTCVPGTQMC